MSCAEDAAGRLFGMCEEKLARSVRYSAEEEVASNELLGPAVS